MQNFEDEDDTHFCNKCHTTINGLENYVRHRQSGCRTCTEGDKPVSVYHSPVSTPNVRYPEILNADAFFSSLELQSSAKPQPQRPTDLLDTKLRRSGRNEERKRKRMRKDKSPDEKPEESKPNLMPVVTDLDDLGIPSLVGFPEIVSTASKQASSAVPSGKLAGSSGVAAGGGAKAERSATDRKRADWLEDTILTDLAETKEELRNLDSYAEYDYAQHDEDSDDESLDVDMVEEEFYSESDDPEHDQEYPPRSHTGGKWRPEGISSQEEAATAQQQQVNEDEAEADEPAHPPPTHTGGKWKPSYVQPKYEYESSKDAQQPPPGHTRGKWVPGAGADIGAGYWCSPCGRKLASRLVYNRHLRSDLHARRSMQEIDGAVQPRGVALPLPRRQQQLSQRQKVLATMKGESSPATCEADCGKRSSRKRQRPREERGQKKQKRRREKELLSCEICRARVRRAQMGKHLLSHYHCRVAGAMPSGCTQAARRFLLENMANIVRQCPFQCGPCRFYCNTGDTFLRHWRSDAHRNAVSKIAGSFVCALCDFCCDDNESVEAHIMKQGHQDVVSMINGSVPIVIRRQRVLTCPTCCRRFRYNIQLRFHAKETGHEICQSASDEYQRRLSCGLCGQIVRSLIALQRHQLSCHKAVALKSEQVKSDDEAETTPYFCSFCSVSFKTAHDAVLHRRTSSHKETVRSKRSGDGQETRRACPHCEVKRENLAEHRKHLLEEHSELCHRCAKCGERFALSQDVTRHTRENRCCSQEEKPSSSAVKAEQWSCDVCTFASDSGAEFLFHKILHDGPVEREEAAKSTQPCYVCPLCERTFRKCALRDHLRKHTGERPFPCGKCSATFARRSDRKLHQKNCQGAEGPVIRAKERKYICNECDGAFYTNS
ncbi:zinc finger protein 11 isoform X2 [Nasonia vitripennis]|uniref:C2H2-type domain-containing protein n=1 Tax=Nasonia vitripennis TaxID=7425 RepID=A0A7M7IUH1_NASVI|nr:zinc finger protein 11 isoform X2 [Nasonia vitripennis]